MLVVSDFIHSLTMFVVNSDGVQILFKSNQIFIFLDKKKQKQG